MDENEKSNGWDELIQDLGAQPDESAFERRQPESQEIPPTLDWEEAEQLAANADESSLSDWNSLAESLGLEVEPEPEVEEPVAEVREAAEVEDEPAEAEVVEAEVAELAEPAADKSATSQQDEDAFGGFLAPDVVSFDEPDESAEATVDDDELPPLPSQTEQALNDTSWSDESEAGTSAEAGVGEDESDDQGMSGEAARSAFDALFADGASGWGSAFLDKPRQFDSDAEGKSRFTDDLFDTSKSDELDATTKSDEEDGDEEERPKRKRSRRRRRGGRGRKSGERSAEGAVEGGEASDEQSEDSSGELVEESTVDGETKKPRRRRSRRRSRSTEGAEGETAATVEGAEGESDEDQPRRGRQRHRNLPTWSEAIGMIVDANLEQRAKSPSKPQSSRGGRGRGGRRRGKKSENK